MIAIAGGKGGCGKTTTALGVARALLDADVGTEPRVVDLDAGMPNLHRMADVDRTPALPALADGDGAIQRDAHGVGIVPAPRALDDVDLPDALDAIRPQRGVAMLDCPAGAGPAATAPLREADAAIIVTTGRPESVEDAAKTGRIARNLGVPVLGAVVTRAERVNRGTAAELATERTIAVPTRREPLAAEAVRERYRSVAGWVEAWRQSSEASTDEAASTGRRRAQSEAGDGRTGWGGSRCPDCGGVISATVAERGATRRRDPRSRRSRGREGTRSSARGGAAPSGLL
jgi:septum site-determining protein MinD